MRKPYPSDLTNAQWKILKPLIPPARPGGWPCEVDVREVLNTLRYQARSGCQWDMLPHDLLPKSTVYDYFAQWRDDGTWQRMGVIAPAPRIMRLFRAFSPSNPPESPSQEESSFASMLDILESKSRSDGPPAGPRSIGLLPDSRSFLTVSAVA